MDSAGSSAKRRRPASGHEVRSLGEENPVDLTPEEEEEIVEQVEPRPPVVFEIVRRRGEHELLRPATSLWWSGIAAGLSIGFSVLSQAWLMQLLPDVGWAPLISCLGYSVGFVLVIMAGQQLFTENTLTAVAPLLASPRWRTLALLARLWSVVLLANIVGACLFALFLVATPVLANGVLEQVAIISRHAVSISPAALVAKGIVAGFLVASLVWILARSDGARLPTIVLITWLIALGDLAHVVAGSVEAAFLVFMGELQPIAAFVDFLLPTLVGNVLGGTVLFTLLAYAQIAEEIRSEPERG